MYFSKKLSQADAKKLFRKLSLELHPDKGGDAKKFIEMQAEFEKFLKGNFSFTDKDAHNEVTSMNDFIKANEFVKSFVDVIVELTGTWVWLSGNTRPYKDAIKENGFKWSKAKKKWFKAPYQLKRKKRGVSFAKIKNKYGYESQKISGRTAIA